MEIKAFNKYLIFYSSIHIYINNITLHIYNIETYICNNDNTSKIIMIIIINRT